MTKRPWLAVSTLAIAAALATRLKPGPLPDGSTLLPSGWRIRPAGRQVTVGTLPLGLATLSDGSVLVTNNGYAENGLMRIDPGAGAVIWTQPLAAAWLGLARTGGGGPDTVWASGAGTNRVYRLTRRGADWAVDTATLADATQQLFVAGIAPVPERGLVAAVGNLSDSVYLLDAATLTRRAAVAVGHRPYTAVADSLHLYVSNWGDSSISVIDLTDRPTTRPPLFVGPHPSALAVSADGSTLYVANGKGAGSGANPDGTYIGRVITGSVSIIPVPDDRRLANYTKEVYALSPYSNARLRSPADRMTVRPPIRHVAYIIRENRTYDQVFGDVRRGNGDRSLAIFNDSVTPNAHAISRRWVLFDNFYVDGEVSADGHEWSDAAFANDYNEKTWPQIYSDRRAWDLMSGEDVANRRGAYLWDAARRRGLWVVNFGEGTLSESDAPDAATNIRTNIPGLKEITVSNYPGFVLDIPDTTRARIFADSVGSWDRQGRFPDLVIMWLPRDHTRGLQANQSTPRAMVADNDLALGLIVERLSRARAWPALAVFALEDDAQNGPDHVDAHRSVLLVASSYARRGAVDSTFYTTSSVLRTIEEILDLAPLSQYDAAATPLWSAFTSHSEAAPFVHLPSRWPLDERNPTAFRSRIPDRDLARADAADEAELNREIWESVHPGSPPPPPRRSLVVAR